MEIKEKIINCLKNIGIEIPNNKEDIDLREYFEDSIMFVSAIVEIENQLKIEIPDEFLVYDKLSSLNSFAMELQDLLK